MTSRLRLPSIGHYSHPLSSENVSRNELHQTELDARPSLTLSNLKLRFRINDLIRKIKFLAPPSKMPFKVDEEWEKPEESKLNDQKEAEEVVSAKETLSEEISNRHFLVRLFEVFEGVILLMFLWMMSVSIVFQKQFWIEVSSLVLIVSLIKLILKGAVVWQDRQKESTYKIYWMQDFVQPLMLMASAVIMIFRGESTISSSAEYVLAPFCLFVLFLQIREIGKKFDLLTLYAEQNKKRKELRIIELFGFTIAMAHLFALMMYAMTFLSDYYGHQNWMQKANIADQEWHVLYIYCYYWANTTMVTVGYGDFTPANHIEAIVVTGIEIVGTAIFGYMINVIGITVNQIQKKNQQFEEHQSTIFKLKEHYQLSRELCFKMKNDIKKKESLFKSIPLKNNEEKDFLDYIQPNLRDEFVLETNMKVIKKSIFFLTHFTVNFQNEIALRLIRFIYKPHETIPLHQNQDRQLLIINNGIVQLYAIKHHNNLQISKLVRSIEPKEGKPTLNVYGYSSLILHRNVALKAITKETAAAYILKRKDILECIAKSMLDFESFNELREKMMQIELPEQIEAPALKSLEKHYVPSVFLLFKKIKYLNQERTPYHRNDRKLSCKVVTVKNYENKTLLMIDLDREQPQPDYETVSLMKINEHDSLYEMVRDQPLVIDQAKNFENFMKKYNLTKVSADYERYCMKKRVQRPKNASLSKKRRTEKLHSIDL